MAEAALHLESVTKQYSHGAPAVTDLSFALKPGQVFGFLGPNGAGKTTTMKMIVGLIHPTQGSVRVFGHQAGSIEAAKHIGYLPENPTLYRYLTALEIVTMHGQLMGLSKQQAAKQAETLLERVGLKDAMRTRIRYYSKGMAQRASLAQALIGNPQLLLLDEPFSGLDVMGRFEMKQLLSELHKEKKTIFFNSHILSEIEEICDQIAIIDQGTLLKHGPIKSFLTSGQTLEHYFVESITKSREKHP